MKISDVVHRNTRRPTGDQTNNSQLKFSPRLSSHLHPRYLPPCLSTSHLKNLSTTAATSVKLSQRTVSRPTVRLFLALELFGEFNLFLIDEMQTEKENRRKRKEAKQRTDPAQYPKPRPLNPRAQPAQPASLALPPPSSSVVNRQSESTRGHDTRFAASNSIQPDGLYLSAREDHQHTHFTHLLDRDLEPPASYGHSGMLPLGS